MLLMRLFPLCAAFAVCVQPPLPASAPTGSVEQRGRLGGGAAPQLARRIFASGLEGPFGLVFEADGSLLGSGTKEDGQGYLFKISQSGMTQIILESPKEADGKS